MQKSNRILFFAPKNLVWGQKTTYNTKSHYFIQIVAFIFCLGNLCHEANCSINSILGIYFGSVYYATFIIENEKNKDG